MSFSAYINKKLLDHLFGKASLSAPTIYVGLSTTTPLSDGSNVTEPANGYARVSTSASDWNSAVGTTAGLTTNANVITFPAATADWGAVTYFVLYDASTSGNFLGYGLIDTAAFVLNTEVASFRAGTLVVTLT